MSKSYLHITNGDGAAGLLKASSINGDVLPWRDTMHNGPFPQGMMLDEVSKVRARYFAEPGMIEEDIYRDWILRNEHIKAASRYERVILWFEHDLLDQLQILQILDWFETTKFDIKKLSLICINHFEGVENFRGLGQLSPIQIATLLEIAEPVTKKQLQLSKEGWHAFRSSDPRHLLDFLNGKLEDLTFLKPALLRHLQEYPWLHDGLTRSERQLLRLIANKTYSPAELFHDSMNYETVYFMGDWTIFSYIKNLNTAKVPLLATQTGKPFIHPRETNGNSSEFLEQKLILTDAGVKVHKGELNGRDAIKRNHYLGGVHIKSNQPMWSWDDNNQTLELVDG